MTTPPTAAPLAEQRQQLRAQLATQRRLLAAQIGATGPPGAYPRSITMRWLMREPALLSALATWAVGRRVAAALPAVLSLARLWRAAARANSARDSP